MRSSRSPAMLGACVLRCVAVGIMTLRCRIDLSVVSVGSAGFLFPVVRRMTDQAADGLCTIDIVLKDDVSMGMASYQELSRAANGLLEHCVSPNQVGGIAMDLGKARRFVTIMLSAEKSGLHKGLAGFWASS